MQAAAAGPVEQHSPTCKTSPSAPPGGVKSKAPCRATGTTCCWRRITAKWGFASSPRSVGIGAYVRPSSTGPTSTPRRRPRCSASIRTPSTAASAGAKAVNFGILYGQGAFGLAETLKIPRKEAKGIIEAYFAEFADLKAYQTRVVEEAKERGYVETVLGRKRWLRTSRAPTSSEDCRAQRHQRAHPGVGRRHHQGGDGSHPEGLREGGFGAKMILQVDNWCSTSRSPSGSRVALVREHMEGLLNWPSRSRSSRTGSIGSRH